MSIGELFKQARKQEIAAREKAAHDQRMIDDKKVDERVGEIYSTAQERQEFSTKLQKADEENNRRLEKAKIHEDEISSLEKNRAEAQAKIESEEVDDAAKETYRKILEIVDLRLSEAETKKAGVQEEIGKSQSEMDASAEDLKKKIQKDKETLGFDSDVHNVLSEIENRRYIEQHKTEISSLTEELLKIYQLSNNSGETFIRPPVDMIRRLQELMRYPLAFEEVYKAVSKNNPSLVRAKFDVEGNPPNLQGMHDSLASDPLFKGLSKVDSKVNAVINRAIANPDMTTEEILAELGSKYEPEVLATVQEDANKENDQRERQKKIEKEKALIKYLEEIVEDLRTRLVKYEVASRFRSLENRIKELSRDINRKNDEISKIEYSRGKWKSELEAVEKDKTLFGNIRDKNKQLELQQKIKEAPLEALIAERDSLQVKIDGLRLEQQKLEGELREKKVDSAYFPPDINQAVQTVHADIREKQKWLEESQKTIDELEQ